MNEILLYGIVSIVYAVILFNVGKKKGNFFYLLISILILASLYMLQSIGNLLLLVALTERLIWAFTLLTASGEDEMVWFYLLYYVPFMWVIYWGVQAR